MQFPRSRACVNPDCRAFDTQDRQRARERQGTVKTYTEDWLAVTRSPPLVYGNVALDDGGNVFIEFADTPAARSRSARRALRLPHQGFRRRARLPALLLESHAGEELTMATGIRDKVAILGMGCSKFGERWDCGPEDLMVEAFTRPSADAGIERDRIEAAWFGLSTRSRALASPALPLSRPCACRTFR